MKDDDNDDERIDRKHTIPGGVTEGLTMKGHGYGINREFFNYFVDAERADMIYLFINRNNHERAYALHMDPRDAEIMGLQLIYQARKMMAEKGENQ